MKRWQQQESESKFYAARFDYVISKVKAAAAVQFETANLLITVHLVERLRFEEKNNKQKKTKKNL